MQRLHVIGRRDDGQDLCYDLTPAIERFFAIKGVEPHAIEFKLEDLLNKSEKTQPTRNKE